MRAGRKEKIGAAGGIRIRGFGKKLFTLWALALFVTMAPEVSPAASHGLAMHGAPELSPDSTHLAYANPDAPKGGRIVFGDVGGFDNLNPFILKGTTPWELRQQSFESLMTRNWDEAFTLYGLLAERVEVAEDRSWVEFTLNPAARFSDGSPVTVEDVIYSMRTLSDQGRPPYYGQLKNVAEMRQIGARGVRFTFREPDREAPLIIALRPILKKSDIEGRAFAETTLEPLIGSGPYVVGAFEPGRMLTLNRNPDYWARDLPIRRGTGNFDQIRIEYFRDGNARWEAFKAGEIDIYRDGDPTHWATAYDFPAARDGRIVRDEVGHGRPTGMRGFVFNTRNPLFTDIRVREALTLAFDFEWVNRTMLAGAYQRIPSPFGASALAHHGAAEGAEREILAPYADALPEGALDHATAQPASRGDGRNRRNLRRAAALLKAAGWTVRDGVLTDAAGAPFSFEILLRSSSNEKVAGVFAKALKRLGVAASVRLVDSAQYQARLVEYDFDMIIHRWAMSLSPGAEQWKYWGSEQGREPGSRNHAGVASPAVDAAIAALTNSPDRPALEAAARALDRAVTAGRYVIPFWYAPTSRIAHDAALRFPTRTPLYGDWIGFLPNVWWREGSGE